MKQKRRLKNAGVNFDVIEFIIKIFILVFVLLFLVMSTKNFFKMKINSNEPRFELVSEKIISAPQMLYFNNNTKQFEYAILDWSKFNEKNLNSVFNISDDSLSLNTSLLVYCNGNKNSSKPVYVNRKYYETMISKMLNYGTRPSTSIERFHLPVLVYYNHKICEGIFSGVILIRTGD